jgi:hypothetical protein
MRERMEEEEEEWGAKFSNYILFFREKYYNDFL